MSICDLLQAVLGAILPNAQNDSFSLTENQALAISGSQITLDVMANDSGIATKLFSIDDGSTLADLLRGDKQYKFESTALGASIEIANGKIIYNFSNLTDAIDALADGQTLIDTFTYAVKGVLGLLDAASVNVTFVGNNDTTSLFVTTGDSTGAALSAEAGLTAAGTLSVTDVDTLDSVTALVSGVAISGNAGDLDLTTALSLLQVTPGAIAADIGDANNLGWSFDASAVNFAYLATGESITLDYTVNATDGHGSLVSQIVTVTVTGSNDGPVVALTGTDSAAAALAETDAGLTAAGTLSVTDADTSDTVAASITGVSIAGNSGGIDSATLLAMLHISPDALAADSGDAQNLAWSFDSAGQAFDYLADGETLTLSYNIALDDGHGGTASQIVTVTVTGSNDGPVVALTGTDSAAAALAETDAGLTAAGTLSVTDADTSDTVAASITGVSIAGNSGGIDSATLLAMLHISPDALAADSGDAQNLAWSFDSAGQAFDYLADGETLTLSYNIALDDGHGGTASQIVTVTVTGTPDGIQLPAVYTGTSGDDFDDAVGVGGGSRINGTDGNDTLVGTGAEDTINGFGGNDIISGGNSRDWIYGGDGDDAISGEGGADVLYGNAGNDGIFGDAGTDVIYGGSGNDRIDAGPSADIIIYGGSGDDTIFSGGNSDVITGGFGADVIYGEVGSGDNSADIYRYTDVRDTGDTIILFKSVDKFDMTQIDADSTTAAKDVLVFGGNAPTAHGVWQELVETPGLPSSSVLYVDTDGNTNTVEMMVTLQLYTTSLTADSFIL